MLSVSQSKTKPDGKKQKTRLFLIDGSSFCYRAYYAIRNLSNSRGEATNAIYGFITMMRKLLEEHQPGHLVICFDRKEPTFRHERFEDYKAHRKPMPDDLVSQLEPIKEFCRAYRYTCLEKAGFEADDLIGTLAVQGAQRGLEVVIVTGDKDALQLVSDQILVLNPNKDNMIYDTAAVKKRFEGLGPEQIVDMMALMGDASDNIPGVAGIGEKTAVKLIQAFGSLENLYENLEKIKSKSQKALLEEHKKNAFLSKELATIDTAVKFDLPWEETAFKAPDQEKLTELCKYYEFRALLKEVMPSGQTQTECHYQSITGEKEFKDFLKQLAAQKVFSFDTETTSENPMTAHLVGMSFAWEPHRAFYVPVSCKHHEGPGLATDDVLKALKPVLENPAIGKYGQNVKYDWMVMKRHGVDVRGLQFDTMLASYLVNPLKRNHNLDDISLEHLGFKKIPTSEVIGKGKLQETMDRIPLETVSRYACEDADCVFRLVPVLQKILDEHGLTSLFKTMEMPAAEVLAKIEMNGVCLDTGLLKRLSEEAAKDLEKLTEEIYALSGETFNINSTKQLADVLFVKMKLPIVKKTKTGASTDVDVLEKLAQKYELPKKILEYRERMKLKSTYLDALPEMIIPETGLVHTSYHQATTVTGRLSSSDPNLQNIPIKTEAGRKIRKAFIPRDRGREKGVLLSADYSQIELRILAHLCDDQNLRKAFREDKDVHTFTATLLYGVSEKDVTREMRNVAKTINFSIIYGKTAFGLSQDLNIPVPEADEFIKSYFKRYSGIKDYLEAQKEKARKDGYLTTLFGRRAYFPEINSPNVQRRQFAERTAVNAPIQGTAADLIKIAMIQIQQALEKDFPESFMMMQVHDELVFDVPERDQKKVIPLIREKMETAAALQVPLKVDVHAGTSWFKE